MTPEMVERVAEAIDKVKLFSRFNDWSSDRVDGCPIEICRYGDEREVDIVVVARFGGAISEREALSKTVSDFRARAAIEAMREPTHDMTAAIVPVGEDRTDAVIVWQAMIDAALK